MGNERTFAVIKPDALEKGVLGGICKRIEEADLKIVAMKMLKMAPKQAEGFYTVHKEKPFFEGLVKYMTSGPCVVLCLEGHNAIKRWRDLMGATDPENAAVGTLRKDYGSSIERNATHGSDALETARFEISFFFEPRELVQYEWI